MRLTRIACGLLLLASACQRSESNRNSARLELLASRSCRAESIREQRFTLANQIRFADDSIAKTKDPATRQRLEKEMKGYLLRKDSLLKHSLSLADTIRIQLDSLMPAGDKAAQKAFGRTLDSLMKAKGCRVTAH